MDGTSAKLRNHAWFALADAERCRLFRWSLTERGTERVGVHDALENTLPEQEYARPMSQSDITHCIEERERRFADEIVERLQRKAGEHKIDHLVIFAPPRMLAWVRMAEPGVLKGHLQMVQGDLMRLQVGQLAEHPMIRELVEGTREF